MTTRDDALPRRSAIKQEAIAFIESLPPECDRPILRMVIRVRNGYPVAKAGALFRREVAAVRARGN